MLGRRAAARARRARRDRLERQQGRRHRLRARPRSGRAHRAPRPARARRPRSLALDEVLREDGIRRFALVCPYVDAYRRSHRSRRFAREGYECVAARTSRPGRQPTRSRRSRSTRSPRWLRDVAAAKPQAIVACAPTFRPRRSCAEIEARARHPDLRHGRDRRLGVRCGAPASTRAPAARWGRLFERDEAGARFAADPRRPCADARRRRPRVAARRHRDRGRRASRPIGPDAGARWPRPFARTIDGRGPARDAGPDQRALPFARQPDEGRAARPAARALHALRGAAAGAPAATAERAGLRAHACSARSRCCAAASPRCTTTPSTCRSPRASRVDAIMQAYADVGMRATVAIDQPNVVEYEKYPFLRRAAADAERRAMDAAPRQSTAELLALYGHLIDALARRRGRPARRGGVVLGAAARDASTTSPACRRCRRRHDLPFNIHILETQAAARARRGEVRQVAGALRARPRPARRTHDGDPRHLDRRRRHRAARRARAAPSPTTRSATCASAAA